jgi:serine/threonine protein kinase
MASPALTSAKYAADFTDYKSAYSDISINEFPECLQATVGKMRSLFSARHSLQIHPSKVLGEGTFGIVMRGSYELADETLVPCAVKVYKIPGTCEHEAGNLWKVSGVCHAIGLHGVFSSTHYKLIHSGKSIVLDEAPTDENENKLSIVVIDLVTTPNLLRSSFNLSEIRLLARQMFEFLKDLQGIAPNRTGTLIHADFNMSNLFWDDRNLTVIDFGLSVLQDDKSLPVVTDPLYRAPEIFLNQRAESNHFRRGANYNESIDVWSAAVCLHLRFTGKFLVGKEHKHCVIPSLIDRLGMPSNSYLKTAMAADKFFSQVSEGVFVLKENISKPGLKPLSAYYESTDASTQQMRDFIFKCLTWDPLERMTVDQALKHPFIKG